MLGDRRVYRYFTGQHAAEFTALLETGLLDSFVKSGAVIETKPIAVEEAAELYRAAPDIGLVV